VHRRLYELLKDEQATPVQAVKGIGARTGRIIMLSARDNGIRISEAFQSAIGYPKTDHSPSLRRILPVWAPVQARRTGAQRDCVFSHEVIQLLLSLRTSSSNIYWDFAPKRRVRRPIVRAGLAFDRRKGCAPRKPIQHSGDSVTDRPSSDNRKFEESRDRAEGSPETRSSPESQT